MTARTTSRVRRAAAAFVAVTVLPLALAACSDSGGGSDSGDGDRKDPVAAKAKTEAPAEAAEQGGPFGPACASVPKDGAGSFDGMAQAPVATAASANPVLSTLVTAVSEAGLVDTLNTAENITVFAPTNAAFAKLPKDALNRVLGDKEQLTKLLTYHVVGDRLAPADLRKGSFETLETSMLTTAGTVPSITVNDSAKVVCGDVRTANARVYLIDTVLMPPAK
ncbi:fasciclin domain-containing protein [Streptomyces yaizuensis]|uniref:Fasciclin domain-containing protein n=1 Tax=Streptomyces yaizuensis TaxID=2989713 RepID=A0ABQ5PAE6_9ACTN|nr:fasciclin domain-containing protein [Streptomyces sp. YSPA8]GLF99201.1 fasciclin domain-containing protein [Streptomyces sp. YSPA8]